MRPGTAIQLKSQVQMAIGDVNYMIFLRLNLDIACALSFTPSSPWPKKAQQMTDTLSFTYA